MKSHHVTTYREDRLKEVSAGTVLKHLGLLSAVTNTGMTEWGLENVIRANPVSLISKPKAPRPRDRRLKRDELERLISACPKPNAWLRPVVIFTIETGMRRGRSFTQVRSVFTLVSGMCTSLTPKNGDSRNVPLSSRQSSKYEGKNAGRV